MSDEDLRVCRKVLAHLNHIANAPGPRKVTIPEGYESEVDLIMMEIPE